MLSATLSLRNTDASCGRYPSPSRALRCTGSLVTSRPLRMILPWPQLIRPDDHVEGGCLAGAVGAEEADDFAAFNGDRQILYHLARSVTLGYAEGFELVHGVSASSAGGSIVMDSCSPHSEEPEVIFFSSMS